jgi:hypothetical protein
VNDGKKHLRIVVDEGASTCIMSISCWKALGSPKLNTSATLLKSFDGHMFQPHGIITTLPIELGGKTVFVDVEVVDAPLEYNLLLGCTWFYEMTAVVSSVFRVLCFPHQGKIVMIDQLVFCTPDLGSNVGSNVPFVGDTTVLYECWCGDVQRSFTDGNFSPSPTISHCNIAPINMISSFTSGSLGSFDPWVVPHPEDVDSYGASMPLTLVDISYQVIQSTSVGPDLDSPQDVESDQYPKALLGHPSSSCFK